jgi:hypothetical protein
MHYLHPKDTLVLADAGRIAGHGLPVQIWTVDEPTTVQALGNLSQIIVIRSIITNDIDLSMKFSGE